MRGHRSRLQNLALALLLGAAGLASSGLSAPPAPTAEPVDSDWTVGADRLLAWGEATEPLRGFGGTFRAPVGAGDGGAPRSGRASFALQLEPVVAPVPARERVRELPRTTGTGARLLGLSASPANAPPGS